MKKKNKKKKHQIELDTLKEKIENKLKSEYAPAERTTDVPVTDMDIMISAAVSAIREMKYQLLANGYAEIDGLFIRVDISVAGKIIPMVLQLGTNMYKNISISCPDSFKDDPANYDYAGMAYHDDCDSSSNIGDSDNTTDEPPLQTNNVCSNSSPEVNRPRRLTNQEKLAIINYRRENKSLTEISKIMNRSIKAIKSVIDNNM